MTPVMTEPAQQQTPKKHKHSVIDLEAEAVEYGPVETPGTWLPQPFPEPLETPAHVVQTKTPQIGSERMMHLTFVQQAPSDVDVVMLSSEAAHRIATLSPSQ